jgi:hypothetical protein
MTTNEKAMLDEMNARDAEYMIAWRPELEAKVARLATKLGKQAAIKDYYMSGRYIRATVEVEGETKLRKFYFRFGWHNS